VCRGQGLVQGTFDAFFLGGRVLCSCLISPSLNLFFVVCDVPSFAKINLLGFDFVRSNLSCDTSRNFHNGPRLQYVLNIFSVLDLPRSGLEYDIRKNKCSRSGCSRGASWENTLHIVGGPLEGAKVVWTEINLGLGCCIYYGRAHHPI
jgi:hypothetical protein